MHVCKCTTSTCSQFTYTGIRIHMSSYRYEPILVVRIPAPSGIAYSGTKSIAIFLRYPEVSGNTRLTRSQRRNHGCLSALVLGQVLVRTRACSAPHTGAQLMDRIHDQPSTAGSAPVAPTGRCKARADVRATSARIWRARCSPGRGQGHGRGSRRRRQKCCCGTGRSAPLIATPIGTRGHGW